MLTAVVVWIAGEGLMLRALGLGFQLAFAIGKRGVYLLSLRACTHLQD